MRVCALAAAAIYITWGSLALADESADFEKARNAYLKKDYGEATTRLEAMLDPTKGTLKTKEIIDDAEFCFGAVKWATGDRDAAHKLWDKVLADTQGTYAADTFTYPSEVIENFKTEHDRWNDELNQHRQTQAEQDAAQRAKDAAEIARLKRHIKELETLAASETVVIEHSRWTGLLPFGIGQFQNGQNALGWFFLVTEAVGVLSTIVLFFPYRYNVDQANAALTGPGDPFYKQTLHDDYAAVAEDIRTADFIILGALGAVVLTGIVHAEITYQPTVVYTRKRKVSEIWPSLAPLPNGAMVGLRGSF